MPFTWLAPFERSFEFKHYRLLPVQSMNRFVTIFMTHCNPVLSVQGIRNYLTRTTPYM